MPIPSKKQFMHFKNAKEREPKEIAFGGRYIAKTDPLLTASHLYGQIDKEISWR